MAEEKRITDLDPATTGASSVRDYELEADKTALISSHALKLGDILTTAVVNDDENDYQAITPEALLKTTANEFRPGITQNATNTEAVAATSKLITLTPFNLDAIFNARFKRTKQYVTGDFDGSASNYDSISVSNLSECVIGDLTVMNGHLTVEIDPAVTNIEMVLNATETPLHLQSFSASLLSDLNRRLPIGCEAVTSSSKLKMILGKFDNTDWGIGSYEIVISLTYLSA